VNDSVREDVEKLLRRGLNHYGLGDVEAAIVDWERVRKLDPGNRAARDYLDSAYEEIGGKPSKDERSAPEGAAGLPESPTLPIDESDELVGKGLAFYRGGQLKEARDRLEKAARLEPDRLDIQGYLELVRGQLLRQYEKDVGDQGRPLRPGIPAAELKNLRLSPVEGYLLSQIDGHVTIEELLSLSTVDRFQTLELLSRLIRDGIIQ
jgi:tetratricopeptide (TPR) repeat protein